MEREEEEACAAKCGTLPHHGDKFISVCPAGHKMHLECILKLFENITNPTCPICRDESLSLIKDVILKQPHAPIDREDDPDFLPDFLLSGNGDSESSESSEGSDSGGRDDVRVVNVKTLINAGNGTIHLHYHNHFYDTRRSNS